MTPRELDEAIYELRHAAAKQNWVIKRAFRTLLRTRSLTTALFVLGMNRGWKRMAKIQAPARPATLRLHPAPNNAALPQNPELVPHAPPGERRTDQREHPNTIALRRMTPLPRGRGRGRVIAMRESSVISTSAGGLLSRRLACSRNGWQRVLAISPSPRPRRVVCSRDGWHALAVLRVSMQPTKSARPIIQHHHRERSRRMLPPHAISRTITVLGQCRFTWNGPQR